ncbi:MAG: hypothetical protein L0229_31895 [Blastocatellia bacterium]|nr:hypothetical protein [Blastocatellia bacterium]
MACDVLAARLVGPAYGWSNLLLCLQSPNVCSIGADHPADAARTSHIFRVLRRCGWGAQVEKMENQWNRYVKTVGQKKANHYNDYHPDRLFIAVMEDVEEATRNLNPYRAGSDTIAEILNLAWQQFLSDPVGYDRWESQTISTLRKNLLK